jgi:hypothetical protein
VELLTPQNLTIFSALVFLIIGLVRGDIVPGYIVKAAEARHAKEMARKDAEIKRWQDMALNLGGMADQANRKAIATLETSKRLAVAHAQESGHDPQAE